MYFKSLSYENSTLPLFFSGTLKSYKEFANDNFKPN